MPNSLSSKASDNEKWHWVMISHLDALTTDSMFPFEI